MGRRQPRLLHPPAAENDVTEYERIARDTEQYNAEHYRNVALALQQRITELERRLKAAEAGRAAQQPRQGR